MSKPEYNKENITKLSKEIVDGMPLKIIVAFMCAQHVRWYEQNEEAFEKDWGNKMGETDAN